MLGLTKYLFIYLGVVRIFEQCRLIKGVHHLAAKGRKIEAVPPSGSICQLPLVNKQVCGSCDLNLVFSTISKNVTVVKHFYQHFYLAFLFSIFINSLYQGFSSSNFIKHFIKQFYQGF